MAGTIIFFIFAIISIAAAWGVVTSKNIVHSALCLALSFAGVAALYVLMNADYLAAVQLLVYTGAISIMVVFAVMLTLRGDVKESSPANRKWGWGMLVSVLLFVTIALVIFTNPDWRVLPVAWSGGSTASDISLLMFTKYMIPFEAAAILLTMALIGAVLLAKGAREKNE